MSVFSDVIARMGQSIEVSTETLIADSERPVWLNVQAGNDVGLLDFYMFLHTFKHSERLVELMTQSLVTGLGQAAKDAKSLAQYRSYLNEDQAARRLLSLLFTHRKFDLLDRLFKSSFPLYFLKCDGYEGDTALADVLIDYIKRRTFILGDEEDSTSKLEETLILEKACDLVKHLSETKRDDVDESLLDAFVRQECETGGVVEKSMLVGMLSCAHLADFPQMVFAQLLQCYDASVITEVHQNLQTRLAESEQINAYSANSCGLAKQLEQFNATLLSEPVLNHRSLKDKLNEEKKISLLCHEFSDTEVQAAPIAAFLNSEIFDPNVMPMLFEYAGLTKKHSLDASALSIMDNSDTFDMSRTPSPDQSGTPSPELTSSGTTPVPTPPLEALSQETPKLQEVDADSPPPAVFNLNLITPRYNSIRAIDVAHLSLEVDDLENNDKPQGIRTAVSTDCDTDYTDYTDYTDWSDRDLDLDEAKTPSTSAPVSPQVTLKVQPKTKKKP